MEVRREREGTHRGRRVWAFGEMPGLSVGGAQAA